MSDAEEPFGTEFSEEDLDFTRGMLVPSTIGVGLYAMQQAI